MHQQCQYRLFGNQSLDTLTSVNYIIKGSILELKDKEYEYNFKNMEINLFSKENETEKIKLMNTVLIVVYVILGIKGIFSYILSKKYNSKK